MISHDSIVDEYLQTESNSNIKIKRTLDKLNNVKKQTLYSILIEQGLIDTNMSERQLANKYQLKRNVIHRMIYYKYPKMLDEATVIILLIAVECTYDQAKTIIRRYFGVAMDESGRWGVYDVILRDVLSLKYYNSVEKMYLAACLLYKSGIRKTIILNMIHGKS